MKRLMPLLFVAATLSQCALAADKSNQSPYDTNPACRDRNVDSTKGDCVILDTGTPRHTYPPRAKVTPVAPGTPATPASSPREAGPASGRKGG